MNLRCPAIQLASWSQTWFPTCRRQVRAISTCRAWTWSQTGSQLSCELLASCSRAG